MESFHERYSKKVINPERMKANNFGGIFSGLLRWD